MLLVNWYYAVTCIGIVLLVWFYVGAANPAVKPGLASEFRFFVWLKSVIFRCFGWVLTKFLNNITWNHWFFRTQKTSAGLWADRDNTVVPECGRYLDPNERWERWFLVSTAVPSVFDSTGTLRRWYLACSDGNTAQIPIYLHTYTNNNITLKTTIINIQTKLFIYDWLTTDDDVDNNDDIVELLKTQTDIYVIF